MIVGGEGIGNEDRGPADHGQFGDGRGAGARDDEMGLGHPARQIGEEGRELGLHLGAGVSRAHGFDVFGPALLYDSEPRAQ